MSEVKAAVDLTENTEVDLNEVKVVVDLVKSEV